jgi:hypothetical protein
VLVNGTYSWSYVDMVGRAGQSLECSSVPGVRVECALAKYLGRTQSVTVLASQGYNTVDTLSCREDNVPKGPRSRKDCTRPFLSFTLIWEMWQHEQVWGSMKTEKSAGENERGHGPGSCDGG